MAAPFFYIIFTTKDTKSTKKYKQNRPLWLSLALDYPFVSFAISVVQAFRFCVFCLREPKEHQSAKRSKGKTNHWGQVQNMSLIIICKFQDDFRRRQRRTQPMAARTSASTPIPAWSGMPFCWRLTAKAKSGRFAATDVRPKKVSRQHPANRKIPRKRNMRTSTARQCRNRCDGLFFYFIQLQALYKLSAFTAMVLFLRVR